MRQELEIGFHLYHFWLLCSTHHLLRLVSFICWSQKTGNGWKPRGTTTPIFPALVIENMTRFYPQTYPHLNLPNCFHLSEIMLDCIMYHMIMGLARPFLLIFKKVDFSKSGNLGLFLRLVYQFFTQSKFKRGVWKIKQ